LAAEILKQETIHIDYKVVLSGFGADQRSGRQNGEIQKKT